MPHFRVNLALATFDFSTPMGTVVAATVNSLNEMSESDAAIKSMITKLAAGQHSEPALVTALQSLFIVHELLHIDQSLGSDHYKDSDTYVPAVATVDYQADMAALWYVNQCCDPPGQITRVDHLRLLTVLHFLMAASFVCRSGKLDKASFGRLSIWGLQATRILNPEWSPDPLHPSMQVMPTLSFPRLEARWENQIEKVPEEPPNVNLSDATQDIVLSIADGRGLIRILRLASTDNIRPARLANAIIGGRLSSIRSELEEFLLSHTNHLGFERLDVLRLGLERVVAAGTVLKSRTASASLFDQDTVRFFTLAELLFLQGLPKISLPLKNIRKRWKGSGWQAAIESEMSDDVDHKWRENPDVCSEWLRNYVGLLSVQFEVMLENLEATGTG